MDADRRKELKSEYKSKPVIGGICCISCGGNGRFLIQAARNVESLKNRFSFAVATKSCPDPSMREEWSQC